MNFWPGTPGASCTGAQGSAAPAGRPVNEGMVRLNKIMEGKTFPQYVAMGKGRPPRFEPDWSPESINLCNKVIGNTLEELTISKQDHDYWKSQQGDAQRRQWSDAKKQGQRMDYGQRQRQGWLDRKAIWNRPCMMGAVGSVVIKIQGMQLEVKDGWIDRNSAAYQFKKALMIGAAMQDLFRDSMLDVVCSKATAEGTEASAGVSRVSCTFYMRLPAFMGLVAYDYWIPRINKHIICGCAVESYLLFGEGKEPMGGTRDQAAWNITVDGVTPTGTGCDPSMVRNTVYNPAGTEAEDMKNMALKHAEEYKQRKEIGDYAWVKNLKLADRVCVPACEDDMRKLEAGSTWM